VVEDGHTDLVGAIGAAGEGGEQIASVGTSSEELVDVADALDLVDPVGTEHAVDIHVDEDVLEEVPLSSLVILVVGLEVLGQGVNGGNETGLLSKDGLDLVSLRDSSALGNHLDGGVGTSAIAPDQNLLVWKGLSASSVLDLVNDRGEILSDILVEIEVPVVETISGEGHVTS